MFKVKKWIVYKVRFKSNDILGKIKNIVSLI